MTDEQIASVVAMLGRAANLHLEGDVTRALSALIDQAWRCEPDRRRLAGGLRVRLGGLLLNPESFYGVCGWRRWHRLLAESQVDDHDAIVHEWWGWAERVSASEELLIRLPGKYRGRRRWMGGTPDLSIAMSQAELRARLAGVNANLRGATQRVHAWVAAHAPARLAAPTAAVFSNYVGLDQESSCRSACRSR